METAIDVQLLTHTPDPIRVMYVAFRTCYSRFTPQQIWADIESGKITEEKMKTFIFDKLKSGHSSPRTQVYFTFAVSGLSRSASHQLVRHNNGITFDQQSQRYYAFKEADFPFVVPETWERAGLREEYLAFMRRVGELYDQALKAGVPAEDARFLLPNAASTNLTFTVNFEEFLHIADLRLCWRAQWEIRHMWAKARNALKARFPELAKPVQPVHRADGAHRHPAALHTGADYGPDICRPPLRRPTWRSSWHGIDARVHHGGAPRASGVRRRAMSGELWISRRLRRGGLRRGLVRGSRLDPGSPTHRGGDGG